MSPIHVYTPREVYGTVGSRVTLSCSFWSREWISEDISITWHFQAEGSRDSISVSVPNVPSVSSSRPQCPHRAPTPGVPLSQRQRDGAFP